MGDRPRITLTDGPNGPEAPCGCLFHYWDGVPKRNRLIGRKAVVMRGVVDPHWHPCDKHQEARHG